jgi:hypothetical protein
MSSRRAAIALVILAGITAPTWWLLAEDKPAPAVGADESDQPAPAEHQEPKTPLLEKTVRLEFKLVNPEDEPTFPIVCATKEFAISRDVSEPNFEHLVEIVGTIVPMKQQGRFLLTFKAKTHHRENNEGIDVNFSAKGSAILEIGKQKSLAVLGESPLKVTATFDE